jgi:hypothetical protein
VETLRLFGKKLDPTDDVREGGVFRGNIRLAIATCVVRQLAIENNLTHLQAQTVVAQAKASGGYHELVAQNRTVLKFDETGCRPSREWQGDKMVGDVNHLEYRARQDALQKEYDERLPIWVLRRYFSVSVTPSVVFGGRSVQDIGIPGQSSADGEEAAAAAEDGEEDGEQDEDYAIDWESVAMVDGSMSEELKTRLLTYCADCAPGWAQTSSETRGSVLTKNTVQCSNQGMKTIGPLWMELA